MQRNLVTVTANAPLSEVVRRLSDHRISGVPVTDEAGHVVGVVSMRDILERLAEEPSVRPRKTSHFFMATDDSEEEYEDIEVPDNAEETAGDVMTAEAYSVPSDTLLPEVVAEFVEHGIHRLLVQDRHQYVGLIGTLDVLAAIAKG